MKRFAFFAPVVTAALLAASGAALAQSPSSEATARYEQDRQKCMTNNTQDSMATCMREATNALDASRKGQLSDPGPIAAANMIPAMYESTANNVMTGMMTAANHAALGVATHMSQAAYTAADTATDV